jgi:hypothetical protein
MRTLAGLSIAVLCASAAAAGAAWAQPGRLSDVAYLQAARCAGLANSSKLGSADGKALKALLDAQANGRQPFILDQADEAKAKAKREGDRADDYMKSKLQSELSGVCASLTS